MYSILNRQEKPELKVRRSREVRTQFTTPDREGEWSPRTNQNGQGPIYTWSQVQKAASEGSSMVALLQFTLSCNLLPLSVGWRKELASNKQDMTKVTGRHRD